MPEKPNNINFPTTIKEKFDYSVDIDITGLYAISISARVKSGKQINTSDDEDLQIEIDGKKFREILPIDKPQYKNIPPAFNGSKLKNLKKTVIFFIWLEKGSHTILLIPDCSAYIENIDIEKIEDIQKITLVINEQAEDGDRRPWFTFVLIDLVLKSITADVTVKWRGLDSDDVKLVINNKIKKNNLSLFHRNWLWSANILKKLLRRERQTKSFKVNSLPSVCYIEFWADKMPVLHGVELDLEERVSSILEKAKVVWDSTRLRKEPKLVDDNILIEEIEQGEETEVLERAIKGDRPINEKGILLSSNRWHRVKYNIQEGYIYSEALEIDGEDQKTIQKIIVQKAKEIDLDAEILLALAQCESRFFPYTVSYDEKLPEIAFGVMQISKKLFIDLNSSEKSFYSPFENIFDIEKNIQGGIKYFEYLYNGKYKDDPDRLRKTIAAYNSGPGNVSLDKSLDLNLHEGQTKRLVNCVLNHLNKGTFKNIIKEFFPVMLLVSLCSLGWMLGSVKKIDNKNLNMQADLTSTENIEIINDFNDTPQPKIIWDRKNRAINFFDENGTLKGNIDSRRLQLDSMFQIPIDVMSDDSIHIMDDEIIEYPRNVFYFLVSTFYMCGMQNCTWLLYKYDIETDFLKLVDDDIFGASISLYLSPDFNKIATRRHVHGGHCNSGEYVSVIYLLNSEKVKVNDFNESYQTSYINSLEWKNNDKIEFEITYSSCESDSEKEPLKETLEYDVENNVMKEIPSILIGNSGGN